VKEEKSVSANGFTTNKYKAIHHEHHHYILLLKSDQNFLSLVSRLVPVFNVQPFFVVSYCDFWSFLRVGIVIGEPTSRSENLGSISLSFHIKNFKNWYLHLIVLLGLELVHFVQICPNFAQILFKLAQILPKLALILPNFFPRKCDCIPSSCGTSSHVRKTFAKCVSFARRRSRGGVRFPCRIISKVL